MTETEALDEIRRMCRNTAWILHAGEVEAVLDQVDGRAERLPEVPGRGAVVRLLVRVPKSEGGGAVQLAARLLELHATGVWWSPADEAPQANFTPWRYIEDITTV